MRLLPQVLQGPELLLPFFRGKKVVLNQGGNDGAELPH